MLHGKLDMLIGITLLLAACSGVENPTGTLNPADMAKTQVVQTAIAQLTPQAPTLTAAAEKYTSTPLATPQPTRGIPATPTPTIVFTLPPLTSVPILRADSDTNCHAGPSSGFEIVGSLLAGETVVVLGKSSPPGWWYVSNPRQHRKRPVDTCWVWSGTTTAEGDTSGLSVITTPQNPAVYQQGRQSGSLPN